MAAVCSKGVYRAERKLRARQGWAEALARIPKEELDRDFAELQAFRETPQEWEAAEWQWPDAPADERV